MQSIMTDEVTLVLGRLYIPDYSPTSTVIYSTPMYMYMYIYVRVCACAYTHTTLLLHLVLREEFSGHSDSAFYILLTRVNKQ